jgi:uncharacterized coiled-coil protein SlyX
MRRIVAMAIGLTLVIGMAAALPSTKRGDAQDQTDERLAALETQSAAQATRIAKQSKSLKSLRTDVDELQTQVAGLAAPSPEATLAIGQPIEEPAPTATAAPTQTATKPAAGPAGSFANPIPFGDEASLPGDWTVKVVDVIPDATDQVLTENQFNDPPADGHQFFIVRISMTNKSAESASYRSIVSFSVVGKSAVAYQGFDAYCGVIPDELPDAEVFPGGTIEGNVCWSIKTGDAKSLVMFADSYVTFNDKDRVYFSLEK